MYERFCVRVVEFGAAAIEIGAGLVCRVHYTGGFGGVLCEMERETGHELNQRVEGWVLCELLRNEEMQWILNEKQDPPN